MNEQPGKCPQCGGTHAPSQMADVAIEVVSSRKQERVAILMKSRDGSGQVLELPMSPDIAGQMGMQLLLEAGAVAAYRRLRQEQEARPAGQGEVH